MPKMKTHRGAAKRFKVTGTGKITRRKAFRAGYSAVEWATSPVTSLAIPHSAKTTVLSHPLR